MLRKRVLVTGASGFLGSHICEALHESGYEVYALVRAKSSRKYLKHDWLKIHDFGLVKCPELERLLKKVDAVVHVAGTTKASTRDEFIRVNVDLTRMFADECIKSRVKRFVFTSSQAAGGPSSGRRAKTEEDEDCPVSAYGESKKKAEEILIALSRKLHSVILRFSPVYGPRDTESLRIFQMVARGWQPVMGYKPLYTNMVYAADAAASVLRALSAKVSSGSVYYVNDGVDYTLDYLYELISEVLERPGRKVRVPFWMVDVAAWWNRNVKQEKGVFNPERIKEFKERYWLSSSEKAVEELGWEPKVNIFDGLALTVRWYRYKRLM
ncbi:NAD-dependent epimerase/dehydratase family protein [candidate division WOR-3 bacterium]|uniref:NAD-dependent epimerase/dehydratase family protein n=1 Tax=candidate division WOR-3 bacterium TaxID=2052148 RepID=A0A9D5KAU6_UNCW3|nr:NAD-dependent epimerase/dehydratase family protein [candidate division WOR-3 bacterium]MBD3365349.1 NAD-dependent epimerase/dehydratase family protein [candidate division WOR-3 bacterium]